MQWREKGSDKFQYLDLQPFHAFCICRARSYPHIGQKEIAMGNTTSVTGPDFSLGIARSEIPTHGVLSGHVQGTAVLLAMVDGEIHAVSGSCTHYGAPLGEGLRVGDDIRCPWHHACFSLRTGQAIHAPAFSPLQCWMVETIGEMIFVRGTANPVHTPAPVAIATPQKIVIVGGGAAGFACAQRLRERGYAGRLTLLSADTSPPVDRPNLCKDYLAGSAPEEWIPLQPAAFYHEQRIELHLDCEIGHLDCAAHQVSTRTGMTFDYDALLLATGAEPNRLPGFDFPNVFTLRTLDDSRKLIAGLHAAKTVAIIGAGFIGLEAAGALRSRGLDVHVITPEALPLARIVGDVLAADLLKRHRTQGVVFHLDCKPHHFDGQTLTLSNADTLAVDAVLIGVGVKPRTALAVSSGLIVDNGIRVDAQLRTSAPDVYAAGDVASYPHAGTHVRVEHWVHAQRQGQCVADGMLGDVSTFAVPPFFWTHHYGIDLRYVGHGRGWNRVEIDGDPATDDCLVRYLKDAVLVAAASIGRDRDLLEIEAQLATCE